MKTVIIGAGQAGAWAARTLRQEDPHADIVLLGQEPHAPYERPPLSKSVMAGTDVAPPCLMSAAQAGEMNIDLRLGVTALAIDRTLRLVRLADEAGCPAGTVAYDQLVLATGGRARKPAIPGVGLPGVHTLRSIDDAMRLRQYLRPGRTLLVLGGGWIGLEVAATARRLGLDVVLIEGGSRLCARSVPATISSFLLDLHRREGVDVRLNGSVSAIERAAGQTLLRVHTDQGILHADAVVLGVGLEPNVELARSCGLLVADGVVVDAAGRTSDPRIYAVGDVANQPCLWPGGTGLERIRLESWANAQNHGVAVGRALAGREPTLQDLPWFWSDQYGVNLQVMGIHGDMGTEVLRGSVQDSKFCLFRLVEGRVQSAVAVNMPKELKLAKRWAKQGRSPTAEQLSDLGLRLETLTGF